MTMCVYVLYIDKYEKLSLAQPACIGLHPHAAIFGCMHMDCPGCMLAASPPARPPAWGLDSAEAHYVGCCL